MKTIPKEELAEILEKHGQWLARQAGGERANLSGSDLSGSDLSGSDLSRSDLRDSDLSGSDLRDSDLSGSDLRGSNLRGSNLRGSDLRGSNLRGSNLKDSDLSDSNLSGSDLSRSDLSRSNLSDSNLSRSNLSGSDLSDSNLSGSNLSGSDLSDSDLSGSKGLLDPVDWLKANLEKTSKGYICYKSFGAHFSAPAYWEIKPGAIITEVVNPLPTLDCACGVNVARKNWGDLPSTGVWKVLIKWEWLPSVVVPYNTDGKFRCGRAQLIEKIS